VSLPMIQSCDGCGLCCLHVSFPPYHRDEIAALPPDVQDSLAAASTTRAMQYAATGADETPCMFLDLLTRRCRHYDHRPEICQDYETGGVECLSIRNELEWGPPV